MLINSVGIQAFVLRVWQSSEFNALTSTRVNGINQSDRPQERIHNDAVREASCEVLGIAIKLGKSGDLRYCPVRFFTRLVTSSVLLLKSLTLGAKNNNMLRSIEILDLCSETLNKCEHDGVHLSAQYGTIIKRLLKRFRKNIGLSIREDCNAFSPRCQITQPSRSDERAGCEMEVDEFQQDPGILINHQFDTDFGADFSWITQDFDLSLASFGLDTHSGAPEYTAGSLDFLWSSIL